MRTLRKQDARGEATIAAFLDEYFYPENVINFSRKKDKKSQFKGIDVVFDYEGKHYIVDEKAAIQYVNKNISTFAFEINYLGRNAQLQDGWFYDETKVTEYYLLSWIKATEDRHFKSEDITELEVLLINRKRLQETLEGEGLTKKRVEEMSKALRENREFGVAHKSDKPFYLYYTEHLIEQPINIVIKKWVLKQLSDFHFTLTEIQTE